MNNAVESLFGITFCCGDGHGRSGTHVIAYVFAYAAAQVFLVVMQVAVRDVQVPSERNAHIDELFFDVEIRMGINGSKVFAHNPDADRVGGFLRGQFPKNAHAAFVGSGYLVQIGNGAHVGKEIIAGTLERSTLSFEAGLC